MAKKSLPLNEKLPKFFYAIAARISTPHPTEITLSGSSNRKFLLISIAPRIFTAIFHMRVLFKEQMFSSILFY
ncbi:MAG: hypothetical protein ABI840_09090, partial [bacterium]